MKVMNVKSGNVETTQKSKQSFDSIYMQPCYYAEIERAEKRKDWLWKVGCKRENAPSDEYSFKMAKLGNINDDIVWEEITGPDFAISLINLYREHGEAGIKQWIKDNNY